MRFKDKRAVVAPAADGIDRRIAERLCEEGARIFAGDINGPTMML